MQRTRVPRKKFRSFKSAIVLFAMLVTILLMSIGIEQSGMPSTLATLLNADFENFRNLEQFDSAQSAEAQIAVAGFWTFAEGDPDVSPVSKREYFEVIDNGIIWKVDVWTVNTPNGERHEFKRVIFGYNKPYSYNPADSSYFCETRIIRQAFIDVNASDTCYGESQVDEIWQMSRAQDDGTLTVNRRIYQPYTGELSEFFPGTDLDAVDRINLRRCETSENLSNWSKRSVENSLVVMPFYLREQAADELVHWYYKPIVLDELARRFDPRAVPDVMPVRLFITPEGLVSELRYRRANIATKRFDDLAVVAIRGWRFPPVADHDDVHNLELNIRVK